MTPEIELELTGPDGANPLGFLCALGTLRALTNALPEAHVKLAWRQNGARWVPVLKASVDLTDAVFVTTTLCNELKRNDVYPPQGWDDTHNIPADEYQTYARSVSEASHASRSRREVDWASTIACESLHDNKGYVDDTAFRTMSGQGHQHFLKQMRLLKVAIQPSHIDEAIFGWRYQDEKLNLRFDPNEDRRHALRWKSPDKDPITTVWGANCLAVQGITMYPAFAVGRQLETTGFRGHRANDTFWAWPLWSGFLNLDCVRSVLALSEIQAVDPDRVQLSYFGIREVFRSQRIMVGKFRAFTPAQPI